jgi:hypothetical protein
MDYNTRKEVRFSRDYCSGREIQLMLEKKHIQVATTAKAISDSPKFRTGELKNLTRKYKVITPRNLAFKGIALYGELFHRIGKSGFFLLSDYESFLLPMHDFKPVAKEHIIAGMERFRLPDGKEAILAIYSPQKGVLILRGMPATCETEYDDMQKFVVIER